MRLILSILFFYSLNLNASESLSYGAFVENTEDNFVINFVKATEGGISMTNQFLDEEDRIYCISGKLNLSYQNIKDIIFAEASYLLKAGMPDNELKNFPISLIILRGLKKKFPCN